MGEGVVRVLDGVGLREGRGVLDGFRRDSEMGQ